MLRVAIPNKGQLSDPARAMLKEAGYEAAANSRELVVQDLDNDVEFFFLRPRDIATYVGKGTLDVGITGQDMLLDAAVLGGPRAGGLDAFARMRHHGRRTRHRLVAAAFHLVS